MFTHGFALAAGFALGVYLLPILIAPEAPSDAEVERSAQHAVFKAQFTRDLPGSDLLHWGEGEVAISGSQVSFDGALAPGPDYFLYFTPELVRTEAEFIELKAQSAKVGSIKTFDRFIVDLPAGVDPVKYRAVVVWCETFGEFITAAAYR